MNNRLYYRLLQLTSLIALTIITLILAGEKNAQANPIESLVAQTPQLPPGSNTDNLPNTPLPDTRERPKIKPLPPIEDFLDTPPNQLPSETIPESEAEFRVKQFKLEGNTVLEPEEVENILKDYRDRPVTFAKLLELETKFTQLYTRKGYINSALIIPSQDVSRGTVTLQAIEGRVEQINVNVNGRLKEGYVRSRLGRGTKAPFNIDELQEALQILQLNPLIESLNAELSVGETRDRWKLDVDVNQAPAFDPVLFVNNNRTPSVGSFQRGLELNHNNVLGYADKFSFIFKNTDGSNDFDTSYSIPINSLDGTVGLRYRYVDSEIIENDFEDLDIESQTDEFEVTLRQPLLVTANSESTQEFALGLEFSRQSNEVTLGDIP
ncbi:MAG: ShlB/FhaC/HecB family hemolysin secretion/activation protein, partial [Waterburya sp.]